MECPLPNCWRNLFLRAAVVTEGSICAIEHKLAIAGQPVDYFGGNGNRVKTLHFRALQTLPPVTLLQVQLDDKGANVPLPFTR